MPAFKQFGPGDQVDNVLILEPQYNLASGSGGWRGSPEGSASLSLYGGARRSPVDTIPDIRYQTVHPGIGQFGQVVIATPMTASVNFVYMTSDLQDFTQRTSTRWDKNHFDTVMRLYQDYKTQDADYVTGSYDHYCLYFQKDSNNVVWFQPPAAGGLSLTASFTVESWVKPFLTSSVNQDFTIASMNRVFWFGITGSTGQLLMSSSYGSFTSSVGPAIGRWSHVAFAYDAGLQVGSFTVNLADVGSSTVTTFSASLAGFLPAFTVGNQLSGTALNTAEVSPSLSMRGLPRRSFHGMLGETRLWYLRRTVSQLSSSMSTAMTGVLPTVTGSVVRARFTEGPLATFPSTSLAPAVMGSGTVDRAAMGSDIMSGSVNRNPWGWLASFDDRSAPVWLPNDNVRYVAPKHRVGPPITHPNLVANLGLTSGLSGSGCDVVRRMLVIDVPQAFYGRSIVPGSVTVTDNAYNASTFGLQRVLVDDGRGGLYVSGSMFSSSLSNRESYGGVNWNKVGNVFYGEGLIVIKDPALLDFGTSNNVSGLPNDVLQVSFRGQSRIPVKTLMCRIDRGDFNATGNPTSYQTDNDGHRIIRHASGSLRVTTVGIYNSDRELVGVARMADPIRLRSRDRMNIKIRMDF